MGRGRCQTSTARISGTVTGEDGVPIADAAVTARSLSTNTTRSARTSTSGFYALAGLQPDEYELTARRLGLAPQTRRIRVLIGQSLDIDFSMSATAVQLSGVQVQAEAGGGEADRRSVEVATNITQEQIESIPLTDRNFLSLATLAPGVRRDGGSITSGAQSANNINVFIDGVSFKNDLLVGGVVGQDASKGNPFRKTRCRSSASSRSSTRRSISARRARSSPRRRSPARTSGPVMPSATSRTRTPSRAITSPSADATRSRPRVRRARRSRDSTSIGEVFNVFDFRNYSGFNTNVGNFNNTGGITENVNFGRPTAVITDLTRSGAPRRFQLGLSYKF